MTRVGRQTVNPVLWDIVGIGIRFPNALAISIMVQRLQVCMVVQKPLSRQKRSLRLVVLSMKGYVRKREISGSGAVAGL